MGKEELKLNNFSERYEKAIEEIIENLRNKNIKTKEDLENFKRFVGKKYKLNHFIKNSEIIERMEDFVDYLGILLKKPVRSVSGINVIAIMAMPYPCPHGKCIYCPGGNIAPNSYTGIEPAAMRAIRNNFDPYRQVQDRLRQFFLTGHRPQKIELIIMGGTFLAYPLDYQEWFVKEALLGLSFFGKEKPKKWISLEEAQRINEKADIRCIGLTIETRPDWGKEKHVDRALRYGATRIELGVQTVWDDILEFVKRGHTVKDSIESTQIIKDSALKVLYHLMPGLPHSDLDRDREMFEEIIKNPDFRPDMIKIYPTLVIKGTKLYEMWKRGEYKEYNLEDMIKLIAEFKKKVPPWIRIMRVQRDIPSQQIEAGVKKSNLRELVEDYMKKKGWRCRCIRCREVGHVYKKYGILPKKIELVRREYEASKGLEIFLSWEDKKQDILVGFLRLRIPYKPHRKELSGSLVRELHVYGFEVPLKQEPDFYQFQHRGLGKRLLEEAERITKEEFNLNKISVISGIGVREYYFKLGYKRDGPYVSKLL